MAKEFRIQLAGGLNESKYTIEEAVDNARQYFREEYAEIDPPTANPNSFEFWIGGFGHDKQHGEIRKIAFQNGQDLQPVQLVSPTVSNRVVWGGQIQAISRLLLGYDPNLMAVLQAQNLDENQFNSISSDLLKAHTPLVHPSMPVQDAINLADLLEDLTKRYVAFLPQADTVGGDTDIATANKHEGFKWIRRKHYCPPHLNRSKSEHAQ